MTTPRYLEGCAAGSEVLWDSGCPEGYAWNVNLHNGNSNINDQTNQNHVRAVRAGECQAATFRALCSAWREARRGKKPSPDQLTFDSQWIGNLLELEERLNDLTWSPSPSTCFIAKAPKVREIHAPAFADRVVHHYLVPKLEAIYEPIFIHDSYSNRQGKGTHAAVAQLRRFVRQVSSGQSSGHYLQLDIANFFNTIHRPMLYRLLKVRMERAGLPLHVRHAVHALLKESPAKVGVRYACTEAERQAVPPHKRLENAAPGCGIAIGNLSSQFFANVYMDRLDQFVKHTLKAQRYLRYVDDFVLVHQDAEQLIEWQARIRKFLQAELRLELKAGSKLAPLSSGIDFLGYVVYPRHTVVRRRVIGHCRAKLSAWEASHVREGRIHASLRDLEQLRSIWSSYAGHFSHANSYRLRQQLNSRYRWLGAGNEPNDC